MRKFVAVLSCVAAGILTGCDSPDGESGAGIPGPSFGSGPDRILKVSGDNQTGAAWESLSENFVVRVIDGAGNPVSGVRVLWLVERGGGDVRPDTSETDTGGEAEARLVLGPELGKNSVQARAGSGSAISLTALFEARATVWPVSVRNFRFLGPGGTGDAELSTGDTVRWTNDDTIAHAIRSIRSPSGAEGFDSGRLSPGESFEFAPSDTGGWTYRCPIHPDRTPEGTLEVSP